MAEELERPGEEPEHESEPHLPAPTIWPAGFAGGIALFLVGIVVSWTAAAVGAGIAVVFGFLWIRDVTREVRAPAAEPEPAPPPRVEEETLEEPPEEEPRYTRSRFLEGSTLGIGALIGGVVTAPVLGFAVAPAFVGQDYDNVDLGPLENFPQGDFVIAQFSERGGRGRGQVHRRTAYVRNNGTVDGAPSMTILSSRCVHLGCPVQPNGPTQDVIELETESGQVSLTPVQPSGFACPCHGGAYDNEGNRTAGPPVRALDRYQYSIITGRLVLGTPYSVGSVAGEGAEARISAYRRSDPGIHVDGLEQFLYPWYP